MTDKILEVRGLTKTYGGVKKKGAKQPTPTLDVLKGIDIDIYRGDVVCLIGPSGCGKSTFLRCLNRLEIPTSGSIKFEGVEVDDAHIDAVRQKMGMVFQHFNLFPHLTVKKNLELAHTGITMLVVTHEMGFAREVSNRVIFIDDGKIQEDEPPQELFSNPKHPRLKAFLSKML